jgi:GrpB-like predicted nucleotidyltransferase (UPF0157 family)
VNPPAPAPGADHILLLPHRPQWAAGFQALAARARAALGELALRIDHIGSTAVAGLPAKDVIDLQVTVASLEAARGPLAAGGFVERGPRHDAAPPGTAWTEADTAKLLWREPAGLPRANLHLRVAGRANQRLPLLMRDYLRGNAPAAAAYGEFKQRLAAAVATPALYAPAKDPVFHLIAQAAERWAAASGWEPGHPDA